MDNFGPGSVSNREQSRVIFRGPSNKSGGTAMEIRLQDIDKGLPSSLPKNVENLKYAHDPAFRRHSYSPDSKHENAVSVKSKKLLRNLLHPLDFYNKKKSRSHSSSSIHGDSKKSHQSTKKPTEISPKHAVLKSNKSEGRSMTPTILHPPSPWPVYKPPLQKRLSADCRNAYTPSPLASPFGSPRRDTSPNPPNHYNAFYNDIMGSATPWDRYSDGHRFDPTRQKFVTSPEQPCPRPEKDQSSSEESGPNSSSEVSEEEFSDPFDDNDPSFIYQDYREPDHSFSDAYSDYASSHHKNSNGRVNGVTAKLIRHPEPVETHRTYDVPKRRAINPVMGNEGEDNLQDEDAPRDLIHLGMKSDKSKLTKSSSVEKLYKTYERIIEEHHLKRRASMDSDRKRHSSGAFGQTYFRGEDPNQAAIVFRDCRGLPVTAPFLENIRRSDLESDESQIMVKFFKHHTTYDLIPTSAKLVIFDTKLQVKKAFYALVYNGVRAAPLWDSQRQKFVGMLTITDFIRILQSFYNCGNREMEELEEHRLELWRTLLKDDVRDLIYIRPTDSLYDAIESLIRHKIHRLPVIDDETGNCLYIITHKRILKFLYLYINDLPKPSIMSKTLRELNIGSYENIETAQPHTLIIEALNKFVERRISALPIVDEEGKLVDIYAKFDVINLAAEGTYSNLDITLQEANEYRNEWFEGVLKCTLDETFDQVMGRIVRAEVHRLVVVDETNKVIGIISLSDILNEMVLKPSASDHSSIRSQLLDTNVEDAMNPKGADSLSSKDSLKRDSLASENTESSSGGELIGDRRVSAPTDSSSAPDPDLDRRVSAPEVKTSQDEDRSRCDNRPVGTATQNPIDDMFNRSMDLPHTEIISMS